MKKIEYAVINPINEINQIVVRRKNKIIEPAVSKLTFFCNKSETKNPSVAPIPAGIKNKDPKRIDE